MAKKIGYRLLGFLLIAFCAGTWAWMLGWLARPLPPGSLNDAPMIAAWIAPGVMGFPAVASITAGLVGLCFVTGMLPFPKSPSDDTP
ncbi:putative membrane protein [Burkholderia pseudomallei MSHR2990]|uniref:hypothetical protein n=1 Tax=Burkholderia pseudomallei TaxID=28450 RepID=UPI000536D5DA|nr:hypothetical protein [Burkholderia pseudomallei]KGW78477.1 putative membrane protein [Burkholderia pseudomallei MSHR2990]